MTLLLYFLLGWAGGAAIVLIINYAIHNDNGED